MTDWSRWSRDAVRLMQERNDAWYAKFGGAKHRYTWHFDPAEIVFHREADEVVADLCVVGTTSDREGTFLWAWSNDAIPPNAKHGLDIVRSFGVDNDLPLLTEAAIAGGRAEALEALAVAGRIQDAEGAFVHASGDLTLFFTLKNFRTRSRKTDTG